MKKSLIAAVLVILFSVILLTVAIFLIVGAAQQKAAEEPTQESAQGPDSIITYVKENWSGYQPLYDPATNVLTLSRETAMDYEAACAYGGSVYEGDLAPETFRQNAASIALDVSAHCSEPSLSVTLCYLSSDGKPIFTVSSGGEIWTCWETGEP